MSDQAPDGPILGLDIGGTKLAVGVATPDGQVLAEARRPSGGDGPDAVIGRLVEMAHGALADAGLSLDDVAAIGIGCGGPLDPWRGVVLNALNNPGWVDVPLVARIEADLGRRPAYLDNDANAAALGEHRFGAGRGVDHVVYLTVSTGVGGGVIADGRLLRGVNGNAAELGHLTVDAHGRPCHCGSVGCVEAYCSGTNIAVRAREALAASGEPSTLRDLPDGLTSADVAAAAADGDPLARRVWDETAELLGAGIASMVHAFNPALVVLGGGVTNAGDLLFEPVRRAAAERTMPWLRDVVRIVPAELGERTGILGAVAVALDGPRTLAERPAAAATSTHGRTDG